MTAGGPICYRFATLEDVKLLAALNHELCVDEVHPNRDRPSEWMEERMRSFFDDGYRAVLLEEGKEVVGYALYLENDDDINLRQFFVARDRRRQGVGRTAMKWLLETVWSPEKRIRVSALVHNRQALAFWRGLGFKDHAIDFEIAPKPRESPPR